MDTWRTAIVDAGPTHISVRGHDVLDLMQQATFTDLIFLLHHERLPSPRRAPAARRDPDRRRRSRRRRAVVRGRPAGRIGQPAIARPRPIAAGVLAIGDEHGGAGSGCMELIAAGLERARRDGAVVRRRRRPHWSTRPRAARRRLPGFGHRVHATIDPRVDVLFAHGRGIRSGRRRHPVRARARSGDRASGSSRFR